MSKTLTGKRVEFVVEFYWRGKHRKPSCNFIYASDNYDGIPPSIDTEAWVKASKDLCKQLVDAGELDYDPEVVTNA